MPENNAYALDRHHRPVEVCALVDWNSQIHLTGPRDDAVEPVDLVRQVLRLVSREITRVLRTVSEDEAFRVRLRLYGGWHKGHEPTQRRKAVLTAIGSTNSGLADLSTDRRIVFTDATFGDHLLHAIDRRINIQTGCHLPGTLHEVHDKVASKKMHVEKMVDTALAADLLYLAARETDWLMVIGQDRDLVPPIFVAEAMLSRTDRRVFLLARNNIRHLALEGLQCRPPNPSV